MLFCCWIFASPIGSSLFFCAGKKGARLGRPRVLGSARAAAHGAWHASAACCRREHSGHRGAKPAGGQESTAAHLVAAARRVPPAAAAPRWPAAVASSGAGSNCLFSMCRAADLRPRPCLRDTWRLRTPPDQLAEPRAHGGPDRHVEIPDPSARVRMARGGPGPTCGGPGPRP